MFKKIAFSIYLFSCANIWAASTTCLTQQETVIYNEIINSYKKTWKQSYESILSLLEKFLIEKNLSTLQAYTILEKQLPCLEEEIKKLDAKISRYQPHRLHGIIGLLSFGSLSLGASLLTLGYTVNRYVTTLSSITRNVLGYGIGTLGTISLIPEILLESTQDGIIMGGLLPAIHEFITHASKKRDMLYLQRLEIDNLMRFLKRLDKDRLAS